VDFDSVLKVDRSQELGRIRGKVEGTYLEVTVHPSGLTFKVRLSPQSRLGDAFSPQAPLPGLRDGQTWTVPSCSFHLYPNNPVEILQAKVEGQTTIFWDGRRERTWLVVFRDDPGGRSDKAPRGRLWVRCEDGEVLRQQVSLFGSDMVFVRMSQSETAALEKAERSRRQR
jgi:hypothetical protein